MNIPNIYDLSNLIKTGLISFRDTNFDLVKFDSLGLALGAGLFIVLCLAYKLFFGRNKFKHVGSGHDIPKRYHQGKTRNLFLLIPKVILAGSIFFMLVSLAKPYLPRTKVEKVVESREIVYLIDMSSSKGWLFENTGITAGQLGREAMLKFLKMRRGQNDRAALWFFSNNPSLREDFIIDDDIFMMQVEDAPYIIVDPSNPGFARNDADDEYVDIRTPIDRIQFTPNEGGTDVNPALDAVIKYFDEKGSKRIKQRALIIESDAAVEKDPSEQLKQLQKKNIKVYLLHIKPNEYAESRFSGGNFNPNVLELLKDRVLQFGGKSYNIRDSKSIDDAYRDINRLETSPVSQIKHLFKVFIQDRFLMVAFLLLTLSVISALIIHRLFAENP